VKPHFFRAVLCAASLASIYACGSTATESSQGAAQDAADDTAMDSSVKPEPDAAKPDAPDVQTPDVPDVQTPDVPDVQTPDVPDVQTPDVPEPDTFAPDDTELDTFVPDAPEPDTAVPDVPPPEDVAPDVEPELPACVPGSEYCACNAGACDSGLVCDNATALCRQPLTCQSAKCAPHQKCTTSTGADAICLPECDANFNYVALSDSCTACVSVGCQAEPCDAGNPALQACIDANQGCQTVAGVTQCGGCLTGFQLDDTGKCAFVANCGNLACTDLEYCDLSSPATPTCAAKPCAGAKTAAKSHDPAAPECKSCSTLNCTGAGLTGNVWPYTDKNGYCLCETLPGYYLSAGQFTTPFACDKDNDGWVRSDAAIVISGCDKALGDASCDIDRKANARCNVTSVDGVLLQDEYGIAQEFVWCGGSDVKAAGECAALPMRLIETEINDKARPESEAASPYYGAGGRQLKPEELTWLTKACIDTAGDYNGDFQSDLDETQETVPTNATNPKVPVWTDDQLALHQFAYFVELYVASYEPGGVTPGLGKLRIRERSRCELEFPLRYQPVTLTDDVSIYAPYAATPTDNPYWQNDKVTPAEGPGKDYWRNCQRSRDKDFLNNKTQAGYDFARFTCAGSGGCVPLPPAHPTINAAVEAGFDPTETQLRGHGVCNLGYDATGNPLPPKDGKWRGMNHSSQFKCVHVVDTDTKVAHEMPATNFALPSQDATLPWAQTAPWVLNTCRALPCDPTKAACQKANGGGLAMQSPTVHCNAMATGGPTNEVGWAARQFRPYGTAAVVASAPAVDGKYDWGVYPGGCLDEDYAWQFTDPDPTKNGLQQSSLCPWPNYLSSVVSTGSYSANSIVDQAPLIAASFGRYSCWNQPMNFLWATDGPTPWALPAWATLCFDAPCFLDDGTTLLPDAVLGLWR
jgi:hypothetical protein